MKKSKTFNMTFEEYNNTNCQSLSHYLESNEYYYDWDKFDKLTDCDFNFTLISKTDDIILKEGHYIKKLKSYDSTIGDVVACKYGDFFYEIYFIIDDSNNNVIFSTNLKDVKKDIRNNKLKNITANITNDNNLEIYIHSCSFIVEVKEHSFYEYNSKIKMYNIEEKNEKVKIILENFNIFKNLSNLINNY